MIWTASGLSLLDVKQAMKSASKFNKSKIDCKQYLIDVDISWILRKLGLGLTKETQIKKFHSSLELCLAMVLLSRPSVITKKDIIQKETQSIVHLKGKRQE